MRSRAGLILGVVLVLATIGGVAGWRWWQGRAPYGPSVLAARGTLEFTDQETANAALVPVNAMHAEGADDRIVLGRVSWTRPPQPQKDGSLRIVLMDRRTGDLPNFISVTAAQPDRVFTGMDSALEIARSRYPWLGDGDIWSGSVVTVSSLDVSPVTFQTVWRSPIELENLLVAVICVGPDGQVYWAQRLVN